MGFGKLKNKLIPVFFILLISTSFIGTIPPAHAFTATGGTITYDGLYTIHTFTTSGTFTVTGSGNLDYLVIAGGGGGGGAGVAGGDGLGGGGAGAFRNGTGYAVSTQAYTITIGGAGAGGTAAAQGSSGGNSIFDTITSSGGGGGGGRTNGAARLGVNGGSGGGGGTDVAGVSGANAGGTGGTGGNAGGSGEHISGVSSGGGGGGGAGAVGANNAGGTAGGGGAGLSTSISGTSLFYAGGGGGGGNIANGAGGLGGGGAGAAPGNNNGVAGTANTGGGGGGAGGTAGNTAGAGGSGIVIFRYIPSGAASPYAVTDLTSTSIGSTSVALDWTAPYAGGGGQTIVGYQINATTPQTNNPFVFLNDTGTTTSAYTATGLTIGTGYSFRVSAWTNNTGGPPLNNATGNVYNATTSMPQLTGHAPVLSRVDDCYHTCTTQLNLEWTASTLNNLRGYKIERETPTGSGWTTLDGNTTNTNTYYNDTVLSTSIIYNYRVYGLNSTGQSTVSNTYEMTTHKLPNAVTVMTATADEFTDVFLDWTAPFHHSPGITNYQINYTTPYGLPQTIWSHPISTLSEATVTGLTIGNDYSFRVTAITIHGMNTTGGAIANSTTSTVFELGNLPDPDTTNLDDFKIFFTRTDTNATSILLDVTYPASYTLSCNIFQKLAATNQTYTGLTETPVVGPGADVDNVVSSFRFNGPNDEIIHVICTDILTGDEAYYIITITDFELLDQIANFRNGTYGTTGKIGGLDLITLFIIIIGMIGFNRVNPIAGVAFSVITIGIAAFFEIIAFYQIMFPAVAMVVLWAYTRTRQHD